MDSEQPLPIWPIRFVRGIWLFRGMLWFHFGRDCLFCAAVALIAYLIDRAAGGWWPVRIVFFLAVAFIAYVLLSCIIGAFAIPLHPQECREFVWAATTTEPRDETDNAAE